MLISSIQRWSHLGPFIPNVIAPTSAADLQGDCVDKSQRQAWIGEKTRLRQRLDKMNKVAVRINNGDI